MASPRRRSSRIQQSPKPHNSRLESPAKLSTLLEREETPEQGIKATLDSLTAGTTTDSPSTTTPTTANGLRAATEKMHPSLFQGSAKKLASEQKFGFNAKSTTSTPTKQAHTCSSTPKTVPLKPAHNPFSSPSFEFRYKRPSSDLSSEAQKLMDDVREQAARIKTELASQREEQLRSDGETDAMFGVHGRRIATPKGKVGRFSDVHLDAFKKMDSIANHASSFRAEPSRMPTPVKALKRTNSKAGLNDSDQAHKKSVSTIRAVNNVEDRDTGTSPAQPSKRQRLNTGSRPDSQRGPTTPSKIGCPKSTDIGSTAPNADKSLASLSAICTPTKVGLPRPNSSHALGERGSRLPMTPRAPSTKSLAKPRSVLPSVPQTDPINKHRSMLSTGISNVKSILRKPQIRFSNDPLKQAAGTHLSPSKAASEIVTPKADESGPSVTQGEPGTPSHRPEKHVNFSPSPVIMGASEQMSPSVLHAPKQQNMNHGNTSASVSYPSLSCLQTESPKRGLSGPPSANIRASVASPGDFTFRADKHISFAGSPSKPATPTIRKVRASDASTFVKPSNSMVTGLPSVPHGLANKKRKRESSDHADAGGEENKENEAQEKTAESPSKRVKVAPVPPSSPVKMLPSTRPPESSPKKKGFLSMSRLNALAKPKQRR